MKTSKSKDTLPTEICMFSKTYSVTYFLEPYPSDQENEDTLFGKINFQTDNIEIYNTSKSNKDEILHTLWHEILHALCVNMGINFKKDSNERIIDTLALGIFHITNSNNLKIK